MKLHKDLANVTVIAAHPFQSQLQLEVSMGGMTWYPLVRPGRDRRRVGAAAASCCPHPPSNCALSDASPAFVRRSRGRPSAWSTRGEARHPPLPSLPPPVVSAAPPPPYHFPYRFSYCTDGGECTSPFRHPLSYHKSLSLLSGPSTTPILPLASSQLHGCRPSHPPFQPRLAPHIFKRLASSKDYTRHKVDSNPNTRHKVDSDPTERLLSKRRRRPPRRRRCHTGQTTPTGFPAATHPGAPLCAGFAVSEYVYDLSEDLATAWEKVRPMPHEAAHGPPRG